MATGSRPIGSRMQSGSWPLYRAVAKTDRGPGPIEWVFGKGMPSCDSFVNIDPQPGTFTGPQHSVPDLGSTGKDLPRSLWEEVSLLDSEIRHDEVEVQIRRVSNG